LPLFAACGSDPSGSGAPDVSKVATATLPATLPEPQIVSGGVVQPGGNTTYTVRSGDTIAAIAERFGVTIDDILAANPGVDTRQLRVGDVLRLPPQAGDAPPPTPTPPPVEESTPTTEPPPEPTNTPEPAPTSTPSSLGQTYTVQPGDIPVTIAERFGITVEELLAANPGVDPRGLQVGDVLIIPPGATAPPE
jgi:LysM repeat protein